MDDSHNQNIVTPQPNDEDNGQAVSPVQPPPEPAEPHVEQPITTQGPIQTAEDPTIVNMSDPPKPPKKKFWSFFRPEVIFIPALRRRLGTKARPLGIVLILIIIFALAGGSFALVNNNKPSKNNIGLKAEHIPSSFKYAVTAFKLVSTVPAANATGIDPATTITLNFNKPVTPGKLVNNMFLTPTVNGTYSAGSNPDQVIFKPTTPFAQGSSVAVMVNPTYQSNSGQQLGSATEYKFTTSIPGNDMLFQDQGGLIDQLSSFASGQKAVFSMLVGDDIGSGASISLYSGDVQSMLSSLVYSSSSNANTVNTASLKKISTVNNVTNNQSYTVQQGDGLYVAVAYNSSGNQVGFVWVDFSNFGVLLRQDDQKVVVDAQSFSSAADVPATVTFYNLSTSVDQLRQQAINGLTTIALPLSPSVDIAIATDGSETAAVPINIPNSGGDIRVDQNLSTAQQVYGVTDKPTYGLSDTVKYAGFVRNDNDALYTNPGSGTVNLYVANFKGGQPLATAKAQINSSGMFSGSFTPQASWVDSGTSFSQLQIFASAVDGNSMNDLPLASFVVTAQANPAYNITVKFSQASYLANNKISALITATNTNGKPMANQTIQVHSFSEDYYENNPAANLQNFGYSGDELPSSPTSVQLNSSGQATFTVSASSLPADGQSQLLTVQANLPGQAGSGAAGGDSAIVHQGNAILNFGLTRQTLPTGANLVSDVYATDLSGSPLTSSTIKYELVDQSNSAVLTSGSVTTDSSGLAVINIPSSQLSSADSMNLEVSTTDSSGNTIGAETYYFVADSSYSSFDTSSAGLYQLNVSGSSGQVKVGDTVNLTVNAPANIKAMVTMDRGRIYGPSTVSLNQGNNTYSFNVSANLAPSFVLTFSYFLNGVYYSEGVPFNVSASAQQANVKLSPASQTVTANKALNIPVQITDSGGNNLQANLIVDAVSSNSYNLSSAVAPSIFNTLFDARPIMTSSSSSLSPIGSGGGRCGGGGGDLPGFANPTGTTLLWQPELTTNASGAASVSITPPAGQWTITVYAMSNGTQVGSASTTITAN